MTLVPSFQPCPPSGGAPIELDMLETLEVLEYELSDAALVPVHPETTMTEIMAAMIVASNFFFPIAQTPSRSC